MPFQAEAAFFQSSGPSLPRSYPARVIQQPVLFLLDRQPDELRVQGMLRDQEGILAVENGWVIRLRVLVALNLPCSQIQLHAAQQRRMRITLEVRVDEVRELAGPAVDLDDVRTLHLAEKRPAAALVNPQQRLQR